MAKTRRHADARPVEGDPFAGLGPDRPPAVKKVYAVRKLRGPARLEFKEKYLVIKAPDEGDAKRQWFNYYGQAQRSHAFDLQVVELNPNHPAAKEAKEVPTPVGGGEMSLQELIDADYKDMGAELEAGGPRVPVDPAEPAKA